MHDLVVSVAHKNAFFVLDSKLPRFIPLFEGQYTLDIVAVNLLARHGVDDRRLDTEEWLAVAVFPFLGERAGDNWVW